MTSQHGSQCRAKIILFVGLYWSVDNVFFSGGSITISSFIREPNGTTEEP